MGLLKATQKCHASVTKVPSKKMILSSSCGGSSSSTSSNSSSSVLSHYKKRQAGQAEAEMVEKVLKDHNAIAS